MTGITWSAQYDLHLPIMDEPHREFIELLDQLVNITDGEAFTQAFSGLIAHTEVHFARENKLMEEHGFFATAIHQYEHQRVLAEMRGIATALEAGDILLARRYLHEHLLHWFAQHAVTMDTALAACIKANL